MHALSLTPASTMKKEELYDISTEHTLNPFLSLDDFLVDMTKERQKSNRLEYVNDTSAIYIGNLDPKVTEEMLKMFLAMWGKVQSLTFISDPATKIFKGYAFATLENPEQHKNAIGCSSKYELFGKKIVLNYRMGNNMIQ